MAGFRFHLESNLGKSLSVLDCSLFVLFTVHLISDSLAELQQTVFFPFTGSVAAMKMYCLLRS